jgi:hypothetical protein
VEKTAVLALLLAAVFAFLASAPKRLLIAAFQRRPVLIFAAPPLFTAIFSGAAALAGVFSAQLALLPLFYARTGGGVVR